MTTHKTQTEERSKSHKPTSPAPQPPTDAFHAALHELEGMRDDVRVRIHLAGMELKQAWNDLDKRYLALRDVANGAKDEALTKARASLMEIQKELHELRNKLPMSHRTEEPSAKPS